MSHSPEMLQQSFGDTVVVRPDDLVPAPPGLLLEAYFELDFDCFQQLLHDVLRGCGAAHMTLPEAPLLSGCG